MKDIRGMDVFKLPMTSLQAVLPSSESIKTDRIDKADCHTGMSLVTVDCPKVGLMHDSPTSRVIINIKIF